MPNSNEYMQAWRKNNKNKTMLIDARYRAKKLGLAFDLELSDIIIPSHCPILGIPLTADCIDTRPSLDRIDNNKGYIKSNVHVISYRANRIKNDASLSELRAIVLYFENI